MPRVAIRRIASPSIEASISRPVGAPRKFERAAAARVGVASLSLPASAALYGIERPS